MTTRTATTNRSAQHLSPEREDIFRTTYDGSSECVNTLARQFGVTVSTIRSWASRLGLTQRSRPRPHAQKVHHTWKMVARHLGEGQEPMIVPDRDTTTINTLRLYLNEMGQYPRLTLQQERSLGERVSWGDEEAKYALIVSNLRLVVRIAGHYASKSPSVPLLDLIQEGTLGLIHAADIYDVGRGWRFSTHATWWIRQAVSRAQMEQSRTIRVAIGAQEQIQDMNEVIQSAEEELTPQAIAERLSLSKERVQELLDASQPIQSLDAPLPDEQEDLALGHALESSLATPQAQIEAHDLRSQLIDLVQALPLSRDRLVITLRYGLDGRGERTLEEVGNALQVTRERVRQIETNILLKLRKGARARQLQEYLSA